MLGYSFKTQSRRNAMQKVWGLLLTVGFIIFGCDKAEQYAALEESCQSDNDCSGANVCMGEICVEPLVVNTGKGRCNNDRDCSGEYICVVGNCVDPDIYSESGGKCALDADCKEGRLCLNGRCEYPMTGSESTGGCKSDGDCKGERICVKAICVFPPTDPGRSSLDAQIYGNGDSSYSTGNSGGSNVPLGGTGPLAGTGGVSIYSGGSYSVPNLPTCGNGIIEGTELCDGANLNGVNCITLGYNSGTLSCDPLTCVFDLSLCTITDAGGIWDGGSIDQGPIDSGTSDGNVSSSQLEQCQNRLATDRINSGFLRSVACEQCICSKCSQQFGYCDAASDRLCWNLFNCSAVTQCASDCCFCGDVCDISSGPNFFQGPCWQQVCLATTGSLDCAGRDDVIAGGSWSECLRDAAAADSPCSSSIALSKCQAANCPMCPNPTCP